MQNKKLPLRKIVSYLNSDEAEGGGFWLPNIQRPFVWNEDQIARLFDSIMREYPNPESGKRNILHYRAEQRDQIANCMLLTADENGFTGKCDKPPTEWFAPSRFPSADAHAQYLRLHLIPNDSPRWALDRYDDFVEARKALIKDKFSYMLQSVKGEAA